METPSHPQTLFLAPASFAARRAEIHDYLEGDIRRPPQQTRAMLVDLLLQLAKVEARVQAQQQELAEQEKDKWLLLREIDALKKGNAI